MIKPVKDSGQISRLLLRGYKSIAECDLELGRINVLIGANGAGKSNFIGFFRLINRLLDRQLQTATGLAGGPDALLHFGRKKTEELHAELYFGNNSYRFTLRPTQDNRMLFVHEALWWNSREEWRSAGGHSESFADSHKDKPVYQHVVPAMRSWRPYHFHDTSSSALVKQMVVDKRGGASTFKRPDAEALSEWLAEYSLGDLWKKNLLGGRPGR